MWLLFTGRHVVSLGGLCSAGGAFKLAPQCEPVNKPQTDLLTGIDSR